ncbi:MAG: flagellar biosynthesis regulator FlaF [Pseudomonadota bacterium]
MQNAIAARAYSQTTRSVGAPRDVEYHAFQRITAMLRAADRDDATLQERAEAVLKNNKLWGRLAADLLSEQNALPDELRASLLSLAEFSRKHGLLAIKGDARIVDLIDINVMIMRGLRGETTAAPEASAGAEGAAAP